jgi:SAM-dependent methyltransferase
LLLIQRRKYARPGGYDAERYWRDRLVQHGTSLKGPGREARSEAENAADYAQAATTFVDFCRRQRVDLSGAAVLEIGCGTGFYTGLCRDAGVKRYQGVDITDALFPQLIQEFPAFEFIKRDATSDELEGAFDVALMIDVVEHIVEERKLDFAMRNVDRCLVPGGVFVVALPAPGDWPRRLFYMRRWRESDISGRLPGYAVGQSRPFRDGHILVLRKPARSE